MGKNKKKSQRPPTVVPPAQPEAGPLSAVTITSSVTDLPVVKTKADELPIPEKQEVEKQVQDDGEELVSLGKVEAVHTEIPGEVVTPAHEQEAEQEPATSDIPASLEQPIEVPEPQSEEVLFAAEEPTQHDELFEKFGKSPQIEAVTENQTPIQHPLPRALQAEEPASITPSSQEQTTSALQPKTEEDLFASVDTTEHDDLFANIGKSQAEAEPPTKTLLPTHSSLHQETIAADAPNGEDQGVIDTSEHQVSSVLDEEQDVQGSPVKVLDHKEEAPIEHPVEEEPTLSEKARSESVEEREEPVSLEQNHQPDTEDDLFGESSAPEATSFFDQTALPPIATSTFNESQPETGHPEKSLLTHDKVITGGESAAKEEDDTDLLFGADTEPTDFDIAVKDQSHPSLANERSDSPPHQPPVANDSSDLFGSSDAAEPDLFGIPAASNEEDDLFAAVGQSGVTDDLFGSSGHDQAKEEDIFASRQETEQELDLFGSTGEMGHDLDFITNPAPVAQDSAAEPLANPTEPTKQRVEDMDLDAAGVPQGWVDEQGGWNWYTAEERLDVARGMFGDEQEVEAEQPSSAGKSLDRKVEFD